jgi:hypothetical protein
MIGESRNFPQNTNFGRTIIEIHAVLRVGWDEAAWHPVSFQESQGLLTLKNNPATFLADLKLIHSLFSRYKAITGIIIVLLEFKL